MTLPTGPDGTRQTVQLLPGAYYDSVTLMRIGRALAERDGVLAAQTAMATELNRELLTELGFPVPAEAGANDLVIAIRATGEAALTSARAALGALLTRPVTTQGFGAPAPAQTTGSAARRLDASLALVSVPGPHAATEAMDALTAGLNVMVFSDNVSVDQEITLKDEAAKRGLIVMGPDCGTAVIGGAGLGFANAVRPGKVGLVAASGTGAQQVMCLLDEAGAGISHALGVGGRDLSAEVSGRSALAALAALDADPATELIVVVSKPPAPKVADLILEAARRLATPTVFGLLGPGSDDLTSVVEKALSVLGIAVPQWPTWPAPVARAPRAGMLHGLFAGGTLCGEARLIAAETLDPSRFAMVDFGDDSLTRGRAHPMIDPTSRLERLATLGPGTAVVLLDVVLGYGSEADPAALLAPAIAAVRDAQVVVSLCGTPADPQDRDRQAAALQAAGAAVFASNAAAARYAVSLMREVP
ncbi:MAG TPA: FdrA family protein [Streptosporangiaceae bacterium]|nr:FdrA family protein [Streptosporangiaceae bacterium]